MTPLSLTMHGLVQSITRIRMIAVYTSAWFTLYCEDKESLNNGTIIGVVVG